MKNIYLCGFMGCGKTTVAKALAKALHSTCFDTDQLIVEAEGMPISQMFTQYGETHFRKAETQILLKTQALGPAVFATGGGILTNEENGTIMRELGTLIYLNTPFDLCYYRIRGDAARPLAISKTRAELRTLYEARDAIYTRNSTYIVPCGNKIRQVVEEILSLLDSPPLSTNCSNQQ